MGQLVAALTCDNDWRNRHLADSATLNKRTAKHRVRHLHERCQISSPRYFAAIPHSPSYPTGAGTAAPCLPFCDTAKLDTSDALTHLRSPSPQSLSCSPFSPTLAQSGALAAPSRTRTFLSPRRTLQPPAGSASRLPPKSSSAPPLPPSSSSPPSLPNRRPSCTSRSPQPPPSSATPQ